MPTFWGLSESVAFGQKFRYFTDQKGPKEGTIWKLILTIFKYKNECYKQSYFLPELWSLKLSKKVRFFCNFVLTSARNLSLLKQITSMHLKGLVTHFQKVVFVTMLWLTVYKIHFHVAYLWSILFCKRPQFWAKATDSDILSYFSRK